jgi:ribosomal protein S18 acetylase RimI-like enzyme
MPTLRKAQLDDAAPLAAFAERAFRGAFSASNDPVSMDVHCARSYGPGAQAREIADPRMATLVCEDGDAIVGYAQLRWGRAPACVIAQRPAQIQRIYVDAGWHGRGVAQALMAGMLEIAAAGGADCVWLGVWEHNPRARAFYGKYGFATVGEHEFLFGHESQRDLVLCRPLRIEGGRRAREAR